MTAKSEAGAVLDASTPRENYAFVLNIGRLVGQDSFEIAPGHHLRRAVPHELEIIRALLKRLPGSFAPPFATAMWEIALPRTGAIQQLPESEWRYFVVAFIGSNDILNRLQEALDLASLELEIGFTVQGNIPGLGLNYYPGRLFHVLEDFTPSRTDFFVDVTASQIAEVEAIRFQLEQHDHTMVELQRLIGQLRSLKALPHQSPLRFLGYFAILEALLTHAPKPTDPYESITRQVRQKVALLDNRWANHLDYTSFSGTPPDKVWTRMYGYRSLLAHGGATSFTGELACLGSHDNALKLIKETVKAVMRQALIEPQLLRDLQNC